MTIDVGRGDVATVFNRALGRSNDPNDHTTGRPRVLRVVPALDALDSATLTAAAAPLHDFCDTNDVPAVVQVRQCRCDTL